MDAKRGYIPEDEKNFSPQSIDKMKTASRQITWLLNEGYDLKQAAVFVGNHFLLSERQRLAIMRSVASKKQILERRKKQADLSDLNGREVWIDDVVTSDSLILDLCISWVNMTAECMKRTRTCGMTF